ncbi:hypothetical protein AaE_004841 [Aphanomyces astaci]|uniref:Uncharacterized protein n=1 Tax=Aphanomyces astaci TaxID=112090 RepID=A0A6A5ALA8_APHAT|nr:hypothetical protein AaE_004841 [Aphanomyces astaci]
MGTANCAKNHHQWVSSDWVVVLSLEKMLGRLKLFKDGGLPPSQTPQVNFERRAVIRKAVLTLPAHGKMRSTRKTIDVGGRILTLAFLREIDKTKAEQAEARKLKLTLRKMRAAKRKAKRAPKKAKGATSAAPLDTSDSESPLSEGDVVESVVL